jgi:hypothetical protein
VNFETLYKTELSVTLNQSDTSVLFTSTRRQVAIRQAEEEFIDLTECLVSQSTVACSCNVSEYNLNTSTGGSTDFVRIAKQGVEYHLTSSNGTLRTVSGDQFPRRDVHWLNRNDPHWRESTTPVEFPEAYYLRPDGGHLLIGLTNPPDVGSSETAKLLVPYVTRPATMTSSSAEPFTVGGTARADLRYYHKALPHYAAYKLLPLTGDYQAANEQLQRFMGYVQRYLQDQRPKGGTHVMSARGYYRESRRGGGTVDRSISDRFGSRGY